MFQYHVGSYSKASTQKKRHYNVPSFIPSNHHHQYLVFLSYLAKGNIFCCPANCVPIALLSFPCLPPTCLGSIGSALVHRFMAVHKWQVTWILHQYSSSSIIAPYHFVCFPVRFPVPTISGFPKGAAPSRMSLVGLRSLVHTYTQPRHCRNAMLVCRVLCGRHPANFGAMGSPMRTLFCAM